MDRPSRSTAVHVARGASYIFLQSVAANVMMVISFSILARLITPVEMGAMAVLLMVLGASRVVVSFGMPSAVTKFIAEYWAKNDPAAAAAVFHQAIRASFLLSLPIAATVFGWAGPLSMWLLGSPDRAILFQVLALDIVITAGLLPALNSAILGLQKIKEMSTVNLAYAVIRQTLIVSLTFATRSLLGMTIAWVVSELALALAFFRVVKSSVGLRAASTFNLGRLARFSFPLFLRDAADYLYTWFDQVALLTYLSLEILGVYTTAMVAFGVLCAVADAVGTSLFPTYSAIHGEHGSGVLSDSIRGATRYLCLIVMPLGFGLFSTAKPSLALFVGEAYAQGAITLMVLSLFLAFTVTSTAFAGLTVVLGETVLSLKLRILSVVVGATSTLVLVPSFGMVGASIARGITMVSGLVIMPVALKDRIVLSFDVEALWKSLVSCGVMAIVVLLVQSYYYSKYLLPAYVVVGGFTYFFMLIVLRAIKVHDIQLLDEYFGARFRCILRPLRWLVARQGLNQKYLSS